MAFTLMNAKAAERKKNFGLFGILAGALGWISDNTTVPQLLTLTGTQNGVNLVFTLATAPTAGILLFSNALMMYPGLNYNLNGSTVTFTAGNAPQSTDVIEVVVY